MIRSCLRAWVLAAVVLQSISCGKGWQLDYGKPAAQFTEETLLEMGTAFIGEKVTVKGIVTRQDLSDPDNCRVYLGHSIGCNLGDMKRMAERCRPGMTVFVDGFLERCEKGGIVLSPAVLRDSSAVFEPME